jgi:hypothetical protein
MQPLTRREQATIAVLGFFFVVACTVELYFLLEHDHLPASAGSNFIAHMFQIYAPADRAYYAPVSSLAIALELLNVGVTQPLGLVLVYGVVKRRPWRMPLQLAVASYLSYSVVLYFVDAHVSGYANMEARTPGNFAIFFGANAPWLIGYGWLALDALRACIRTFAAAESATAAPAGAQRQRSNSGIGLRPSSRSSANS